MTHKSRYHQCELGLLGIQCALSTFTLYLEKPISPDKTTPVGVLVQLQGSSLPMLLLHRQSIVEQSRHRAAGELVIPDMTKAFYKESYVDKIKKVRTSSMSA